MINSVLLPNESNQPLVDNTFIPKNTSDLLLCCHLLFTFILIEMHTDILSYKKEGSWLVMVNGKHSLSFAIIGRKKVHPFVELLFTCRAFVVALISVRVLRVYTVLG